MPLAILKSAGRRQKAAQAAQGAALGPFHGRDDLPPAPVAPWTLLAASAAMWVGARPAGRLNPAPGLSALRALRAAADAAGVDPSARPR